MNSIISNAWEDRTFIVDEVSRRVLAAEKDRVQSAPGFSLETLVNEAVTQEQESLGKVAGDFHRASEAEREAILIRIASLYVGEIHSSFNPRLHNLAARVLPPFLKLLLNRVSPARLAGWGKRLNLDENLIITGPMDHIRRLAERGTLILAPTHVSHLDSIVVGLGLHQSNLPPFTYGAGLNLFSNPMLSYFLSNVGAYKVDRRKKSALYKDTLKQYAQLSMECGRHNLFFPGGTRNRRGGIDRHLKLGLLGCGLSAYLSNLRRSSKKPDIFVVPATLSYGLVLEAKTLIEEHLREEGKSRFIRERDDFSKLGRMLRFWRNLRNLDSKIHLHFCEPLDLFGNPVNAEGVSHDRQGRTIDRLGYLEIDGRITPSLQRDQEYTRELGQAILASYQRNNTAMCTHVAAFASFSALRTARPETDFYQFLRGTGPDFSVPLEEVLKNMAEILEQLRRLKNEGRIRLEETLLNQKVREVFNAAMMQFKGYHDGEALRFESGRIWSLNLKLLYYYRNRLDYYGLPA